MLNMPRIHTRTTSKGIFTENDIKAALLLVKQGKSIRDAAKHHNLSSATLHRYAKKEQAGVLVRYRPNYDWKRVFTDEQEAALEKYIATCSKMFYGLSIIECRRLAYEMAINNQITVSPKWHEMKMAGEEWMKNFRRRRNSLSLRTPEACSLARATSFNRYNVNLFFDNLETVLLRSESFANGTRIFNLDETATTTVQRPQKVLSEKGIKSVCQVTSGEKGTLVTTCAIISASGQYIPPAIIFPRVHFKAHMLKGGPPGTLGLATQTGWMNTELFVAVMKHFIRFTCSSKENPTLLIYDNHESHLSLAVLDVASENGVTILTFPPHSTNKMQPLDVGVFGPFKTAYNGAVDSWLICNPGKGFTIYDVAHCVGIAYKKAMTPCNITAAFKKTGIFPFDKTVFSSIDFLPSSVTDREISGSRSEVALLSTNPEPSTSTSHEDGNAINQITPKSQMPDGVALERSSDQTSSNIFKGPETFRGFPKAGPRSDKRKRRKRGRSMIATDTPEKIQIANKKRTRNLKLKGPKRKIIADTSSSDEAAASLPIDMHESDSGSDLLELKDEMLENFNKSPQKLDYVLVKFRTKGNSVFYVGKVISNVQANGNVDVSFLRKKGNSFVMPNVPDMAQVPVCDVKLILPAPMVTGITKRQKSHYVFPVSFATLNMR